MEPEIPPQSGPQQATVVCVQYARAGWIIRKRGRSMMDVESYRQYAAECVRQAGSEETPEDKNILLNVALAWLRLAQQTQAMAHAEDSAADSAEHSAADSGAEPEQDKVMA
jgi:hypothetical protein